MFGRAALDGLRHNLPCPGARRLARLGLEPLDEVRGIAARVGLELLEQPLARLVGGQRGDTLEFALLVGHQGLVLGLGLLDQRVALGQAAFAPLQVGFESFDRVEAFGERLRLVGQALLGPLGLEPGARACFSASTSRTCAVSLASRAASFFRVSISRSASRTSCAACCSALPTVSAAIRRLLATHQKKTASEPPTDTIRSRKIQKRRRAHVHVLGVRPRTQQPGCGAPDRGGAAGGERGSPRCRVGRSHEPAGQVEPLEKLRFRLPRTEVCAPRNVATHLGETLAQASLRTPSRTTQGTAENRLRRS